MLGSFGW